MERITFNDLPKGLFEKLRAVETFISKAGLDKNLLELVRLRISQLNGCSFCVDMHHKELRYNGETDLRLSSLCVWKDTPYFSDQECTVLLFAEAVTVLDSKPIPKAVFNPLLTYFTKEQISYLCLAVTQINTWNRLMKVFRTTPGEYKVGQFEEAQL